MSLGWLSLIACTVVGGAENLCGSASEWNSEGHEVTSLLQRKRTSGDPVSCAQGRFLMECQKKNKTKTCEECMPSDSGVCTKCIAGEHCSIYGMTFPCPVDNIENKLENKLNGSTRLSELPSVYKGGFRGVPVHPSHKMFPSPSYGPVKLKSGPLKDHLIKNNGGIKNVEVLDSRTVGYGDAFDPPLLGETFPPHGYDYIWGDLGSEIGPGYGGLRTYDVVRIKPSEKTFHLYHLGHWHDKCDSAMCSIWWGTHDLFATSMLNASINIQTCTAYDALVRCSFTEKVEDELLAVVGQGWPRTENGTKTGNCSGSFIKELLAKNMYPDAPDDAIQFVLPACQIAHYKGMKCDVCHLPAKVAPKITNLAAQFEHNDEGVTCRPLEMVSCAEDSKPKDAKCDNLHR